METRLTLEIATILYALSSIVGILIMWFKMENKINLQNQKISHLEAQDVTTHKRIDSLKNETVQNTNDLKEKYDQISVGVNELKVEMERNKGEILSAIAKIKT